MNVLTLDAGSSSIKFALCRQARRQSQDIV